MLNLPSRSQAKGPPGPLDTRVKDRHATRGEIIGQLIEVKLELRLPPSMRLNGLH